MLGVSIVKIKVKSKSYECGQWSNYNYIGIGTDNAIEIHIKICISESKI